MRFFLVFLLIFFISLSGKSENLNIFGIGIYDVKLDGSKTNDDLDLRFERRFD